MNLESLCVRESDESDGGQKYYVKVMDDKKYDMYDTIEVRGVLPSPRASELSCGHHSPPCPCSP